MENPPTIKLEIPPQDLSALSLFQPDAEAARSWVGDLPVSNTSLMVQMLDQALNELNRTRLPPETRYSIVDALLPSLDIALSNLSKRFLNQPLVMPPEAQRMAEFSDSLLTMAATAHAIVAIEAIQQRDAIRKTNPARLTCQAIQRALVFTGRKILRSFQLHRPVENHTWQLLHQLYVLAENQQLADLPIPEPLTGSSTIKATYLQALLLDCCKPNQLRPVDLAALYRGLQQWSELVQLQSPGPGDDLFMVDLDSDQPAQYRALYKQQPGAQCRTINTSTLLEHLGALQEEIKTQGTSFDKNTSVPANMLEHLIACLGNMSLRNFKRTSSNGPLWICVGLSGTHYHVARQQLTGQMTGDDSYVPEKTRPAPDNPFVPALSKGDLWDKANPGEHYQRELVSEVEDHIELDSATRARLLSEEIPEMPPVERHPVCKVRLADTSPNGYCLEWVDDLPGDIKAGDIVALKENEEQKEWAIADIRWLSRLHNHKTLIGVELLSPRAIAYGASIHLKGGKKTPPMRVLLLPEIKLVGQPDTLITPRAGFKERQKVTLRNKVEVLTVQLQRQVSSTGGFDRFEFCYLKELGDILAENQAGQAHRAYDSLWSNI